MLYKINKYLRIVLKSYLSNTLILSLLLLSGCDSTLPLGEEKPHQVNNTSRPINTTDIWHHPEYVNIDASYDKSLAAPILSLEINFIKPITPDVKHFQIYIDADNNPQTGFSGGQEHYIIQGADYMIEEGNLFKSTSNTAWTWSLQAYSPSYQEQKAADSSMKLKSTFDASQIFSNINTATNINVSIEPVNEQWQDTNNFVLTQAVPIQP